MDVNNHCYSGRPLYILHFDYHDHNTPKHLDIGLINLAWDQINLMADPTDGQNIDLDIFLIYNSDGNLLIGDTRSSRIITQNKINKNNIDKIPAELKKIFDQPTAYKLYGGELNRAFSDFMNNLK